MKKLLATALVLLSFASAQEFEYATLTLSPNPELSEGVLDFSISLNDGSGELIEFSQRELASSFGRVVEGFLDAYTARKSVQPESRDFTGILNLLGAERWELITTQDYPGRIVYLFKRQKE